MCPANTLSVTCSLQLAETKEKDWKAFLEALFPSLLQAGVSLLVVG
jgi:hypothetical protein